MRTYVYFLISPFLLLTYITSAQVGIGTTTPDPSAALEIESANTGLIIPRVSLVNVNNGTAPIDTPATSLLVYNTNASVSGGDGVGYYYWDGAQWDKLVTTGTLDSWKLSGNSGTDPTTDFLGTADSQDLVFRTDNTERMRLTSTGNVGINDNNPSNTLEVNGSFLLNGDFINQQAIRAASGTVQSVPFTNLAFNPLIGTVASITITDGNGVNNSAVLVTGFARVFGGNLNGASSSMGGYFMVLERDTNPAFSTASIITYTSGTCYIKTPNGAGSAAIGYGGGGHISYLETSLSAGVTYYYRLTLVPNSVGITSGTFDVYQRSLNVVQIKL